MSLRRLKARWNALLDVLDAFHGVEKSNIAGRYQIDRNDRVSQVDIR